MEGLLFKAGKERERGIQRLEFGVPAVAVMSIKTLPEGWVTYQFSLHDPGVAVCLSVAQCTGARVRRLVDPALRERERCQPRIVWQDRERLSLSRGGGSRQESR